LSSRVCLPECGVHASVKIVSAYIVSGGDMNTRAFKRTPVAQAISPTPGFRVVTFAFAKEALPASEDNGAVVVTGSA